MKAKPRPMSPFMIGPYYKPQLTSLMSITHRATGVFLSVIGAPLLLWFLIAVSSGPEAYQGMLDILGTWLGKLVVAATLLCLSYHLLNGIRHLVWDSGRALDIKTAYTAGWMVLAGSVVLTAVLLGVVL
ncbi:MAG: succinate dehydrogenase, cytochrome b556 subunit [Xanthomonadales bacterium]|nr:succinate dehydrogenase, cytochrome b556 subunit [Gammaproteobacteria bacterium]NND56159.1 succinate dehydrogenase, cytochrome b556 subunit [Xanthomonadales bacterium]NNK50564.1 succinate dehydrogenase, cytochrome b556 subunit [Xanthomonadales bacterium]